MFRQWLSNQLPTANTSATPQAGTATSASQQPACVNPDDGAPESRKLLTTPVPVVTTSADTRLVREGLQIRRLEATVKPLAQEASEPESSSELGTTHGGHQT